MRLVPFTFLTVFLAAPMLHAQVPNNINSQRERQESTRFNERITDTASAIEEKEAEEDLGRLSPASQPKYFRASNDTRIEWDSNSLLQSSQSKDDMITTETLTLNYTREVAPQWKISANAIQNFFWYKDTTSFDFMGQVLTSDLSYQFTDGPQMSFGPTLARYENTNQGNQLIQSAGVHLVTSHGASFFEGKSSLFYGYGADGTFTDPSPFDRQQHQVFLGWNQTLVPARFIAQGFYRFAYTDYLNVDREDKNNLVGLNLIFRINEYVSINGFLNYTRNDSTLSSTTYRNLASGASLNVSYPF